jgi:hypothetical protein
LVDVELGQSDGLMMVMYEDVKATQFSVFRKQTDAKVASLITTLVSSAQQQRDVQSTSNISWVQKAENSTETD